MLKPVETTVKASSFFVAAILTCVIGVSIVALSIDFGQETRRKDALLISQPTAEQLKNQSDSAERNKKVIASMANHPANRVSPTSKYALPPDAAARWEIMKAKLATPEGRAADDAARAREAAENAAEDAQTEDLARALLRAGWTPDHK